MRILHVHDIPRFEGGVEQILFDTARGLAKQGWSQALLHSDDQKTDAKFLSAFGFTGSHREIIMQYRPDAILMHKVADHEKVNMCSRLAPTVHMVHDHDLVCPRRHKYFPISKKVCTKPAGSACYQHLCCFQRSANNKYLPVSLSGTAGVKIMLSASKSVRSYIVGSRFMQSQLVMNGIEQDKINIVNPVPAALTSPRYIPMQKSLEILFVGQVIRGKGVDLMLKALAKVAGPWNATIVGTGNHLAECRQLASKLKISDSVVFTGRVDHEKLESYYAAATLVVVPSRWPEPFGMVGIEAMARGRPVVAFDTGGIGDWLANGETGYLVKPDDKTGLAAAIQRLLDDPELARELGLAAVDHVKNKFSHQTYLEQIKYQMELMQ